MSRPRLKKHRTDGAFDRAREFHIREGDCYLAGVGAGCACGLRLASGEEDIARIRAEAARLSVLRLGRARAAAAMNRPQN